VPFLAKQADRERQPRHLGFGLKVWDVETGPRLEEATSIRLEEVTGRRWSLEQPDSSDDTLSINSAIVGTRFAC
jgi:hypothetical protein